MRGARITRKRSAGSKVSISGWSGHCTALCKGWAIKAPNLPFDFRGATCIDTCGCVENHEKPSTVLFFFSRWSYRTRRFSCCFWADGPLTCSQYFPKVSHGPTRWFVDADRRCPALGVLTYCRLWWHDESDWVCSFDSEFYGFCHLLLLHPTPHTSEFNLPLAGSWGTLNDYRPIAKKWTCCSLSKVTPNIWSETKCCCNFLLFRNKIVAILHHFNRRLKMAQDSWAPPKLSV